MFLFPLFLGAAVPTAHTDRETAPLFFLRYARNRFKHRHFFQKLGLFNRKPLVGRTEFEQVSIGYLFERRHGFTNGRVRLV